MNREFKRYLPLIPAFLLAMVAAGHAASNVLVRAMPERSVWLWPGQAVAHATRADRQLALSKGMNSAAHRAEASARQALQHEPTNPRALRTLALLGERGFRRYNARQLMQLSFAATRRDPAVQVWLMKDSVTRSEFRKTIYYADIGLRTVERGQPFILPVLAAALADEKMVDPLAEGLGRNPPWAQAFWAQVPQFDYALENVPVVLRKLGKSKAAPDAGLLQDMAAAMITSGKMDLAAQTVETARPGKLVVIRHGFSTSAFAPGPSVPPFEWDLAANGQIEAAAVSDGGLLIDVSRSAGGVAARRLLALEPAAYTIVGVFRSADAILGEMPFVRLRCAEKGDGMQTTTKRFGGEYSSIGRIIIAADCRYQWIEIVSPPVDQVDLRSSELIRLEIKRGS